MAEVHTGVRELKAHLSEYLRTVKAGAVVVITERGKPVGRIVPVSSKASVEARLEELLDSGSVLWNRKRFPARAPRVQMRGKKTLSDLIIEDRE